MSEESTLTQALLSKVSAEQATIIEFFAVFSRFEYSLKRSGFINKSKGYFGADWNKFARCLEGSFDKDRSSQLKAAVDYLAQHPPKKQISETEWKDVPWKENDPILKWLLDAICRVRNNLFHGGKFRTGSQKDPARDQKLLESSLCILEECLRLEAEPVKKVRRYFEDSLE